MTDKPRGEHDLTVGSAMDIFCSCGFDGDDITDHIRTTVNSFYYVDLYPEVASGDASRYFFREEGDARLFVMAARLADDESHFLGGGRLVELQEVVFVTLDEAMQDLPEEEE